MNEEISVINKDIFKEKIDFIGTCMVNGNREARETVSYIEGKAGLFYKVFDRYILKEVASNRGIDRVVKCGRLTEEEQGFFENILFNIVVKERANFNTILSLNVNVLSKKTNIAREKILEILSGFHEFSFIFKTIIDGEEKAITGIYPFNKVVFANEHFNLQFDINFLDACLEVNNLQ